MAFGTTGATVDKPQRANPLRSLIVGLVIAAGLTSSALADETRDAFERGAAAQRDGDNAAALEAYTFAAERGDADAQGKLGILYMYGGRGIARDLVQAHMWLSLAAANVTPGKDRAASVTNGQMVAGLMNPAQIAEAKKLARDWTEAHAAQPE